MARIGKDQKVIIVEELKDKFARAKGLVVANYHGISVPQMQELKKDLKKIDAEFSIAKNTLIKLATKGTSLLKEETLTGPTAILFSYKEPIEAIKKLADFIKKYNLPKIKIGILDNEVLTSERVIEISKIPGKQELYAKVVSSLNSPIYGLVATLSGNLRNLVYVLTAIKDSNPPTGGSKGGATN